MRVCVSSELQQPADMCRHLAASAQVWETHHPDRGNGSRFRQSGVYANPVLLLVTWLLLGRQTEMQL
jgi:hypothetical protein